MNCPIKTRQDTEWLLDYSAGRLDRERAALMERHLETCRVCARFVEAQSVVWNALSRWEARELSPDFDRRLYRKIEQAKPASWLDRLFAPLQPLWRPVVPVAAACLLIVAGVALHTPQAVMHPRNSQARVESIEPEQVERTLDDMQMLRELAPAPRQEANTPKSM
jgi:anti-sigma factor RsiW